MNSRDEYGYQGLAELYLGWARRVSDPDEVTTYIAKAEEEINEGLKQVRVRDGLWIVSSEIKKWLGERPAYLRLLEKAVSESPGSIIARYLLGRAYRDAGQPEKAVAILEKVIRDHPNEFRPCVDYARALLDSGKAYPEAIAVLRLSTLYGLSDPRFVATLGGLLFMNGEFSAADKIFSESIKREFPATELIKIQFRPTNYKDGTKVKHQLKGTVTAVKAGYAFIEVPGYPRFFCPGSKFGSIIMRRGMEVTFEPGFSARGAIADNLRLSDK